MHKPDSWNHIFEQHSKQFDEIVLPEAFTCMVIPWDPIQTQKYHLVQHKKQHHWKVLLSSFHLNGHTLGFHPQTQKLEPPCTA